MFTGLDNFKTLLFDPTNTYYKQLRKRLVEHGQVRDLLVPFCIAIPLLLAVSLQSKCRGHKFYQALYYLPSLMSITTVTLTWRTCSTSITASSTSSLGSTANGSRLYTWIMLVVVTVWWLRGLQHGSLPKRAGLHPHDHFEAAAVDGANGWQRFWHIVIPVCATR